MLKIFTFRNTLFVYQAQCFVWMREIRICLVSFATLPPKQTRDTKYGPHLNMFIKD